MVLLSPTMYKLIQPPMMWAEMIRCAVFIEVWKRAMRGMA